MSRFCGQDKDSSTLVFHSCSGKELVVLTKAIHDLQKSKIHLGDNLMDLVISCLKHFTPYMFKKKIHIVVSFVESSLLLVKGVKEISLIINT